MMHAPKPKYGWSQRVADDLEHRAQIVEQANDDTYTPTVIHDEEGNLKEVIAWSSPEPPIRYNILGDGAEFMTWYHEKRLKRSDAKAEMAKLDALSWEEERKRAHEWGANGGWKLGDWVTVDKSDQIGGYGPSNPDPLSEEAIQLLNEGLALSAEVPLTE